MSRRKLVTLSNKNFTIRHNNDIVQQHHHHQQQLQYFSTKQRWHISINDIAQDSGVWGYICNYSRLIMQRCSFDTSLGMRSHPHHNTVLIRICNIVESLLNHIEANISQLVDSIMGCSSSGCNIDLPITIDKPRETLTSKRREPYRQPMVIRTWLIPFFLLVCSIHVIDCKKHDVTPCKLPCKNAGVCVKGKDHVLPVYGEDTSLVSLKDQTIQTDYCTCPLGYTGAYCEIKYVMCPDNETKMCGNGAPCQYATTDYGDAYYHCECDISGTDLSTAYARELCQKVSTVFCSITAQKEKDQYRKSLGITGSSFCMNGGKCVEPSQQLKGRHHAGCLCPTGWIGNHCEKPDPKINPQYAEKPNNPDPLFLRQHLQHVQEELAKGAAKLKLHKSNKARSFISYMLSFIITFLLIFTGIGLVFWIYMNYFQHRSISITSNNNVLSSVMILGSSSGRGSKSSRRSGGSSNGGRSKTSSSSNGGRKKKLSAAERARIPQRTNSSNSFFLSQQQPQQHQQVQQYDYSLDGGYSSSGASSHQRRRRNNNNSNSRSRQKQQQQQQYRDDPIPVSEIELS